MPRVSIRLIHADTLQQNSYCTPENISTHSLLTQQFYSTGTVALGGSFKLVTLAPKTVREMTQLPKETQKMGAQTIANHLASTDNLTRTTKRQHT